MMFTALRLASAFLIEPELLEDERGFFARTWCAREFTAHGLNPALVQCNISFNRRKGTLRGMHFQAAPHEEARLVQCSMGSIYDVIIDLRPESATYKQHLAVVLSAENHLMLYVPEGFAHGFQTLEDSTQVFYQMSEYYSPAHSRGVRWNDPAFGIPWPLDQPIMLSRDQNYPDFAEAVYR